MTRLVEVFFNFALELRSVSEFFGVQKIMERFFNLFSFIASDNYRDANRKKFKGLICSKSISRVISYGWHLIELYAVFGFN